MESVRQTWDPGWEWQEAFCQNWNTYGRATRSRYPPSYAYEEPWSGLLELM